MIYNISMRIGHLLENEQAAAVFDQFLPGVRKMAESDPQARQLSVEQLIRYSRLPQGEELLPRLNAALTALNTPENAVSPSEAKQIERFLALDAADREKAPVPETHHQDAVYPGRPWLDTKGERIQAHGARCSARTACTTGTAKTKSIPTEKMASGHGGSRYTPLWISAIGGIWSSSFRRCWMTPIRPFSRRNMWTGPIS